MTVKIEITPEQLLKELAVFEEKLAEVELLGGVTDDAKSGIVLFKTMMADFDALEAEIAALRPGLGYEAEAERLSNKRATMLLTLQALAAATKEAVDDARLGLFDLRDLRMAPLAAEVEAADTAALAALQSFADSMPRVRLAYQAWAQGQRIVHVIGKELAGPEGQVGEGRPAPPFARSGDANPGPVAAWIALYINHFLALAPAPGAEQQDLAWFYKRA